MSSKLQAQIHTFPNGYNQFCRLNPYLRFSKSTINIFLLFFCSLTTQYRLFGFIFLLCLALHTNSFQTLNPDYFIITNYFPSVSISAIAALIEH